jgi:hypothetical protein
LCRLYVSNIIVIYSDIVKVLLIGDGWMGAQVKLNSLGAVIHKIFKLLYISIWKWLWLWTGEPTKCQVLCTLPEKTQQGWPCSVKGKVTRPHPSSQSCATECCSPFQTPSASSVDLLFVFLKITVGGNHLYFQNNK